MEPSQVLPAVALLSLVTVEYGGWALLGFLTRRTEPQLTPFQEQFFRAGHGHAGVLLVLSLACFSLMPRADLSETTQWAVGGVLLGGILAQSGGFFLHMMKGAPGQSSIGTKVTRAGAMTLGVPLIVLAVGLLRA